MREFLSYVLESFQDATGWSRDNGYADMNVTANELLNFRIPRGLRMTLASLATPQFATSYSLGSIGVVDGSVSYLHASVPLANVVAQSAAIDLPILMRSYRQLHAGLPAPPVTVARASPAVPSPAACRVRVASLFPFAAEVAPGSPSSPSSTSPPSSHDTPATTSPPPPTSPPTPPPPTPASVANALVVPAADQLAALLHGARQLVDTPTLLFGRLYLPGSMLEAYLVKRLAPSVQLELRTVSDARLPSGGTVLGVVQMDRGRYGIEGVASSDGGLLGVRGLYNFGAAAAMPAAGVVGVAPEASSTDSASGGGGGSSGSSGSGSNLHGRFSAGGEIYYGTLNKSGGISLGARWATLPGQSGTTPLTATMTVNPLMGNIRTTYAVVASEACSLATQLDFNVYSYESEWAVGMELWSKRRLAGLVAVDVGAEPAAEAEEAGKALSQSATVRPLDKPIQKPQQPLQPLQPIPPRPRERSFQAKLEWRLDDPTTEPEPAAAPVGGSSQSSGASQGSDDKKGNTNNRTDGRYQGVLKARLDQNLKLGLLWEGRIKSLLFSLGSGVDLHRLDQPFRTLGLEIQFSS